MFTDKQISDFLYSILSQLDVRPVSAIPPLFDDSTDKVKVDWSVVAQEQNISNGHAARMRWHRIKTQKAKGTGGAASSSKTKNKGKVSAGKASKAKEKEGIEHNSPLGTKRAYNDVDGDEDDEDFSSLAGPRATKQAKPNPSEAYGAASSGEEAGTHGVKQETRTEMDGWNIKSEVEADVVKTEDHTERNEDDTIIKIEED